MKRKKSKTRLALSFAKSFACIAMYQAGIRNAMTWWQAIPIVIFILVLFIFIDKALYVKEQLKE